MDGDRSRIGERGVERIDAARHRVRVLGRDDHCALRGGAGSVKRSQYRPTDLGTSRNESRQVGMA